MRDMLLVLDFDHLQARTAARKLRAERVCCNIVPGNISPEAIREQEPLGLILAGGAAYSDIPLPRQDILSLEMPVLALSSMAAWLCGALGGGTSETAKVNEVRTVEFESCPLLESIETSDRMFSSLQELTLTPQLRPLARTRETEDIVGFSDARGQLFGMQIDIEQHDPDGVLMLINFAMNVCGCTPWWDEDAFVLRSVQEIKRVAGEGAAMCAMTGGLSSGVSALLAYKALGSRLHCVFVDTGLLRENEGDAMMAYYHDKMGLEITRVSAQDEFMAALRGITSGEEKRCVIGKLLNEILAREQAKIDNLKAIIKGTSYTDVFLKPDSSAEAETKDANELKRVEPVRQLFKDEVRQVGEYLGMPSDIISRQPFPGSGLALRILGEVTEERLKVLRAADLIFRQEIESAGQGKRLWQHFAVLSAQASEEGHVVCLRAVHATDGALAYAARLPYDMLEAVVARILKECPSVSRVVYDMTPSGHYAGIEWQ